jgi:hypothetical protein
MTYLFSDVMLRGGGLIISDVDMRLSLLNSTSSSVVIINLSSSSSSSRSLSPPFWMMISFAFYLINLPKDVFAIESFMPRTKVDDCLCIARGFWMLFLPPMTRFVKLPCDGGPPKKEILCDDAISAESSSLDSISSNILFLIGLFE